MHAPCACVVVQKGESRNHCQRLFGMGGIRGRDAMGGGKKRGVENLTNEPPPPPPKGFWTPPRTVRFAPLSGVSAQFFLYKNPRQSRPEALWRGPKIFGRASSLVRFAHPPPYVLHPPLITAKGRGWPQLRYRFSVTASNGSSSSGFRFEQFPWKRFFCTSRHSPKGARAKKGAEEI